MDLCTHPKKILEEVFDWSGTYQRTLLKENESSLMARERQHIKTIGLALAIRKGKK